MALTLTNRHTVITDRQANDRQSVITEMLLQYTNDYNGQKDRQTDSYYRQMNRQRVIMNKGTDVKLVCLEGETDRQTERQTVNTDKQLYQKDGYHIQTT